MTQTSTTATFWDHLDILRGVIIRTAAVWLAATTVAFLFKDLLFDIALAPKGAGFVTYRVIADLCRMAGTEEPGGFAVPLVNTGLARQFMIHMQAAMCAGAIVAAPYALFAAFSFVAPGLYGNERRYFKRVMVAGYLMFMTGIAVSYWVIFPLTVRFLGTYQVSPDVVNLISLESYMGTLVMMCLCMGVVFQLPVVAWLCARLGVVSSGFMARFRRHAIVVILVAAAVITPTTDVFTLLLVSVPVWLLYEASIQIVRRTERRQFIKQDIADVTQLSNSLR